MTFDEFHKKAYPRLELQKGTHLLIYGLGLAEEAGEVAGKIKKLYRDKEGIVDDNFEESIVKELGDVLFYIRNVCDTLGLNIEDAAFASINKLNDREKRGTLHGEGDDR